MIELFLAVFPITQGSLRWTTAVSGLSVCHAHGSLHLFHGQSFGISHRWPHSTCYDLIKQSKRMTPAFRSTWWPFLNGPEFPTKRCEFFCKSYTRTCNFRIILQNGSCFWSSMSFKTEQNFNYLKFLFWVNVSPLEWVLSNFWCTYLKKEYILGHFLLI